MDAQDQVTFTAHLQSSGLAEQTRFGLLRRGNGGETKIMSRGIEEIGFPQPFRPELIAARGVGAVPHSLHPITAWQPKPDGQVVYRAVP